MTKRKLRTGCCDRCGSYYPFWVFQYRALQICLECKSDPDTCIRCNGIHDSQDSRTCHRNSCGLCKYEKRGELSELCESKYCPCCMEPIVFGACGRCRGDVGELLQQKLREKGCRVLVMDYAGFFIGTTYFEMNMFLRLRTPTLLEGFLKRLVAEMEVSKHPRWRLVASRSRPTGMFEDIPKVLDDIFEKDWEDPGNPFEYLVPMVYKVPFGLRKSLKDATSERFSEFWSAFLISQFSRKQT